MKTIFPRAAFAAYFAQTLDESNSAECSHLAPSMFHPATSEEAMTLPSAPVYNNLTLDEIEALAPSARANKNQRIDISRKAVRAGKSITEQMDGKVK